MNMKRFALLAGVLLLVGGCARPDALATQRPLPFGAVTSPALFVVAHPDDETLAASVALAEHLAAGQDVHVLWLTDGTASAVRNQINGTGTNTWWKVPHTPSAEGYATLDPQQFGDARIREATNAVLQLGTGYSGTLTLHRGGLQDGAVTVADAKASILAVADQIAPGAAVRIKTHTWVSQLDLHPDHISIGQAVKELKTANPTRFGDVRYYIEPQYWSDPDLGLVSWAWDNPTDAGVTNRVLNACRAYQAWAPAGGQYAIGYHSTSSYFDTLTASPKSMFHP